MLDSTDQEGVFLQKEADAWFSRNFPQAPVAVSEGNGVLRALRNVGLGPTGTLLDVGGGPGHLSAGFLREYPAWSCTVLEPSAKAISAGRIAFPQLQFAQGSIAQRTGFPRAAHDLVIVSGVFSWVDRVLLAQAVANVDGALKDGGLLVIADFDPPYLRANPYHHHPGLFTYKQDYCAVFGALGIYHVLYRHAEMLDGHTSSDKSDPYDRQWASAILRKDLYSRYARSTSP